jgi:tRNA(adenine34) deaminase
MTKESNDPLRLKWSEADFFYMRYALSLAEAGSKLGEVPVGAVIVGPGGIIAESFNQVEALGDPTSHAEMIALRLAAKVVGRHALADCVLYVTLEPCVMCAGGLVNARLRRVCFGARDDRFGGCRSIYRITDDPRLNHRLKVDGNLLGDEASEQLRNFFAERRLQF